MARTTPPIPIRTQDGRIGGVRNPFPRYAGTRRQAPGYMTCPRCEESIPIAPRGKVTRHRKCGWENGVPPKGHY